MVIEPCIQATEKQIRGRNLVTLGYHTITITSDEVEEALRESVYIIVHTIKAFEQTPPELSADIDKGVVITGGEHY